MSLRGFPHSEIPGSKLVCSLPGLIAAYRVLHRLLAPRHSPYALSSLTTSVSNSLCRTGPFGPAVTKSARSLLTLRLRTLLDVLRTMFEKNYRLQDIQLSKNRRRAHALPAWESPHIAFSAQNMVENTGLEPVTSWLQTRRSPS
jgi:hypothetical protein